MNGGREVRRLAEETLVVLSPKAMNFVNFSRRSGNETATLKLQLA